MKHAQSQRGEVSDEKLLDMAGSALELFGVGEEKKQQQAPKDPDDWRDKDIFKALGDFFK